jgi:Mg-chelatase subunit ChlD
MPVSLVRFLPHAVLVLAVAHASVAAAGAVPDAAGSAAVEQADPRAGSELSADPAESFSAASRRDLVLVLDNSGGMRRNDPQSLAVAAISGFIDALSDDVNRVAVIVYDQAVRMPVPLTGLASESRPMVNAGLVELNYRGLFTDTPAAVERALYELGNNGRQEAQKVVVLLSGGGVDTGNVQTDRQKTALLLETIAPEAKHSGIPIYGVAFSADADVAFVKSLTEISGGEYLQALRAEDLAPAFMRIHELLPVLAEADAPEPAAEPGPPEAAPRPAPELVEPVPETAVIAPPVQPIRNQERLHSIVIVSAGSALIVALAVLIFLLVRRGRDIAKAGGDYVADAWLLDKQGHTGSPMYQLGRKPAMIGRVAGKDTDHLDFIVIPQSTIGRRHALIEYKDYGYWIMDQGSINGTFVNDRAISSEVRLKHGDRVRLHRYEFEFVMPEMGDSAATVISHTTLGSASRPDEESTLLKGGLEISGAEESEPDIFADDTPARSAPTPVAAAAEDEEEDTVLRGGQQPAVDETILPGASSLPGDAAFADHEEATLLPGTAPAFEAQPEAEDETLIPGEAAPEKSRPARAPEHDDVSSGDGFFDITGGDTGRK